MRNKNLKALGAGRFAILASLLLSPVCADYDTPSNQKCAEAILSACGTINFVGHGYGQYYESACQNPLKVASIYANIRALCLPEDVDPGAMFMEDYCMKWGKIPFMPLSKVAENVTQDKISKMRVLSKPETKGVNMTEPILITEDWYKMTAKTIRVWYWEQGLHKLYGWASYGFWGTILLVGMLIHGYESLIARQVSSSDIEGSPAVSRRKSSGISRSLHAARFWVQKHLVIPSVLAPYRRQPLLWCSVPTRMEGFIVAAFWIISIVLGCVNYQVFVGNTYYNEIAPQLWRYIADRTGIMSYANLPILWIFSGRNNIFLWATGWQFATFNVFHRHVARIATIQAIVHSVAYTVFYWVEGGWDDYLDYVWKEPWWYMGVVATITLSLLCFFSSMWFRQKCYETFLIIHIVFSVVTIVGLFYHTWVFDTKEYDPYLWPLVAIWVFDRFLRLIRQVYCNIYVSLRRGKTLHTTKATVEYDRQTGVLTIVATPGTPHLTPGPGQHYFLYQPFRWRGWENHPFTLGFWNKPGIASEPVVTQQEASAAKSEADIGSSAQSPRSSVTAASQNSGETQLIFWITPCDGWTKKLKDDCLKSSEPTIATQILLEGPYGMAEPLHAYEELVLIAGGSGIAATAPYVLDYMRRSQRSSDGKINTRTRHISVVWAHRSTRFIQNVADKEFAEALTRDDISPIFHSTEVLHSGSASTSSEAISQPSEEKSVGSAGKDSKAISKSVGRRGVSIARGRPDVAQIISKAAKNAHECESRVAVMVCGPAGLADATRDATHKAMLEYVDCVEYFEEAFGW